MERVYHEETLFLLVITRPDYQVNVSMQECQICPPLASDSSGDVLISTSIGSVTTFLIYVCHEGNYGTS